MKDTLSYHTQHSHYHRYNHQHHNQNYNHNPKHHQHLLLPILLFLLTTLACEEVAHLPLVEGVGVHRPQGHPSSTRTSSISVRQPYEKSEFSPYYSRPKTTHHGTGGKLKNSSENEFAKCPSSSSWRGTLRESSPPPLRVGDILPSLWDGRGNQTLVSLPDHPVNVLFVKTVKTGGTTVATVLRSIAATYGLSNHDSDNWIEKEPGVTAYHMTLSLMESKRRLQLPSFRLTWVRDPGDRCLSQYYYLLSKKKGAESGRSSTVSACRGGFNIKAMPFTEKALESPRAFLAGSHCLGVYQGFLKSNHLNSTTSSQVINNYHLVGVQSRFEESILLLQKLLGLSLGDILYTSAKRYSSSSASSSSCLIPRPPLSEMPGVEEYLNSKAYLQHSRRDREIVQEAERRLDSLIDAYGRERFHLEVEQYKR